MSSTRLNAPTHSSNTTETPPSPTRGNSSTPSSSSPEVSQLSSSSDSPVPALLSSYHNGKWHVLGMEMKDKMEGDEFKQLVKQLTTHGGWGNTFRRFSRHTQIIPNDQVRQVDELKKAGMTIVQGNGDDFLGSMTLTPDSTDHLIRAAGLSQQKGEKYRTYLAMAAANRTGKRENRAKALRELSNHYATNGNFNSKESLKYAVMAFQMYPPPAYRCEETDNRFLKTLYAAPTAFSRLALEYQDDVGRIVDAVLPKESDHAMDDSRTNTDPVNVFIHQLLRHSLEETKQEVYEAKSLSVTAIQQTKLHLLKLIKEFIDTETAFRRNALLLSTWADTQTSDQQPDEAISKWRRYIQPFKEIGDQLNPYLAETTGLCQALSELKEHEIPPEEQLADLIQKGIQLIKIIKTHFLDDHSNSFKAIINVRQNQESFQALLDSSHKDIVQLKQKFLDVQEGPQGQLSIESFAMSPIQRIGRYKLLLDQMITDGQQCHFDEAAMDDLYAMRDKQAILSFDANCSTTEVDSLIQCYQCDPREKEALSAEVHFLMKEDVIKTTNAKAHSRYLQKIVDDQKSVVEKQKKIIKQQQVLLNASDSIDLTQFGNALQLIQQESESAELNPVKRSDEFKPLFSIADNNLNVSYVKDENAVLLKTLKEQYAEKQKQLASKVDDQVALSQQVETLNATIQQNNQALILKNETNMRDAIAREETALGQFHDRTEAVNTSLKVQINKNNQLITEINELTKKIPEKSVQKDLLVEPRIEISYYQPSGNPFSSLSEQLEEYKTARHKAVKQLSKLAIQLGVEQSREQTLTTERAALLEQVSKLKNESGQAVEKEVKEEPHSANANPPSSNDSVAGIGIQQDVVPVKSVPDTPQTIQKVLQELKTYILNTQFELGVFGGESIPEKPHGKVPKGIKLIFDKINELLGKNSGNLDSLNEIVQIAKQRTSTKNGLFCLARRQESTIVVYQKLAALRAEFDKDNQLKIALYLTSVLPKSLK